MGVFKKGLDYFSFDTDIFQSLKIKCLKREFGCEGVAVYTYLMSEIFRVEGFWVGITPELLFDISDYLGVSEERIRKIIVRGCELEIFNNKMFKKHSILTSEDIQRRYFSACQKLHRKANGGRPTEYLLVEISGMITSKVEKGSKASPQNDNRVDKREEKKSSPCPSKRGV